MCALKLVIEQGSAVGFYAFFNVDIWTYVPCVLCYVLLCEHIFSCVQDK